MATRLYTTGAAAGISPTVASGWDATGDLIRKAASRATADYAQILATPNGSGGAGEDVVHFQMVYGPLAAGSFNGTTDTVKGQFPAREVSGLTDARAQIVIRAIAPNGSTVRFTALDFDTAANSSEFVVSGVNTSVENRKFPRGGAATLAAGSWSAGDYLVIEVGHRNHGTNTNGVRVISGGTSRTGDLAENETTTIDATGSSAVGWVEFSTNISPITQAAANVATTVAFTANNAKTTIKPTANVATTVAFTANDATISYLTPPRTVLINSVDYTTKIRWDSFSFIESANRGQVGMSGFDIDDATNTIDIPALKLVAADEPRAGQSNKRMFTGFTHDRTTERGPVKVAGQRQWGVELLDLNTLADDYILTDAESADRPAETDYARVVWLLTTRFNTVAGVASGVVPNSNTANMDATDYRGRRARDVLNECSEMAGKNWFVYLYTTATPLLFYDVTSGSNLTSSARISDVAADVDSSVTWAASGTKVHRSPDDIYSTVHLRWNEGTVSRTNATTASTYRTREISVSDMSIASSAQAIVKADAFLAASASEKIRVDNVSVVLPAANVNDIRAGQRIEIKLDRHGISAFTYYRILQRQVEPLNDISYKVTLTLADQVLPVLYSGGGRGGDLPYGIWEKKSNATDDGATVIIDRGGITVTDGAITVTNAGAIVIIDGTSNMFKIAASGSQSKTQADKTMGTTNTTISSLTYSATPVTLLVHSDGTTPGAAIQSEGLWLYDTAVTGYIASSSGGSPTTPVVYAQSLASGTVVLDGSSHPKVTFVLGNTSGVSLTLYEYYYILIETAF